MAGYGSQGIQGHHLFVQELMEDFGDQFSKLLPGWDVDGEYNLAARASNNKIAAQLKIGMHLGSHKWLNDTLRGLLTNPLYTNAAPDQKTKMLGGLVNVLLEAEDPTGAKTNGFFNATSRSDPHLLKDIGTKPDVPAITARTANALNWETIQEMPAYKEVADLPNLKVVEVDGVKQLTYDGVAGKGFFSVPASELSTHKIYSSSAEFSAAWAEEQGILKGDGGYVYRNGERVNGAAADALLGIEIDIGGNATKIGDAPSAKAFLQGALSDIIKGGGKFFDFVNKYGGPLGIVAAIAIIGTSALTASEVQAAEIYDPTTATQANKDLLAEVIGAVVGELGGFVAGGVIGALSFGFGALPAYVAASYAAENFGKFISNSFYDLFVEEANLLAEKIAAQFQDIKDDLSALADTLVSWVVDALDYVWDLVVGPTGLLGLEGPLFGADGPLHAMVEPNETKALHTEGGIWSFDSYESIVEGTDEDDVLVHNGWGTLLGGKGDDVLIGIAPQFFERGEVVYADVPEYKAEKDLYLTLNGGEGDDWVITVGGEKALTIGGIGRDWIFNTSWNGVIYGDTFDGLVPGLPPQTPGQAHKDYLNSAANSDKIWFRGGTTMMDPTQVDTLAFFGYPLVGGTNDLSSFVGGSSVGPLGFGLSLASALFNPYYFDYFLPFMSYYIDRKENTLYAVNILGTLLGGTLLNTSEPGEPKSGVMVFKNYDDVAETYFGAGVSSVAIYTFATKDKSYLSDMGMIFKNANPLLALFAMLPGFPGGLNRVAPMIDDLFMKAGIAMLMAKSALWFVGVDPLVLDLDGDGIETISIDEADVWFDLDNDLFGEKTGWLSGDDGFLVRDLNQNGKIDGIAEMFGGPGQSGVAMLAAYDENGDGRIDVADAIRAELRVWRDFDGDAVTDAGEIFTLDQLGVVSLSLATTNLGVTTPQGTLLERSAAITFANGSISKMFDAVFEMNDVNSKFGGEAGLASWLGASPISARGFGQVADLGIASSNDFDLARMLGEAANVMTIPDLRDMRGKAAAALGQWGFSLDQTRELTPVRLSADGATLLDRGVWVEDAAGGYWTLQSGAMISDANGVIARPDLEQVMAQTGGWRLEQVWSPSTRSEALVHREAAPYLMIAQNGRAVVLDYGIENTDGSWRLASGQAVLNAQGVAIAAPTKADILAQSRLSGQEWRTEALGFNPLAALDVDKIGIYQLNGKVIDYTVQVTDDLGSFTIWARNLDQALELQDKYGTARGYDLRAYAVNFATLDIVDSDDTSAVRVELLTPGQFNFATELSGITFNPAMLTATLNRATGVIGYSVNDSGEASLSTASYVSGVNAMIALLEPVVDQYITASRAFALRMAFQGGLSDYFTGITYNAATDQFAGATDRALSPMFTAIFAGAPDGAIPATEYLQKWHQILSVMYPDYKMSGSGNLFGMSVALDQKFIFQMMLPAYQSVGIDLTLKSAMYAVGVNQDLLIQSAVNATTTNGTTKADFFLVGDGATSYRGGNGADTYFVGATFGNVLIEDLDYGSPDELRFTAITSAQVIATRIGQDLILRAPGNSGSITVKDHFLGELNPSFGKTTEDRSMKSIVFADGVLWDQFRIAMEVSDPKDTNDIIVGSGALDVLNGGRGNDVLQGKSGGDLYIFARGDGQDVVTELNPVAMMPGKGGLDFIQFVGDVSSDDLHLSRAGESDDLLIRLMDANGAFTGDSITIVDQFDGMRFNLGAFLGGIDASLSLDYIAPNLIEKILFEDGSWLDYGQITQRILDNAKTINADVIYGFIDADDLDGGFGDDLLIGREGGDTYMFGKGYGRDILDDEDLSVKLFGAPADRLEFKDGLRTVDFDFLRIGGSDTLTLRISGTTDEVVLNQQEESRPFLGFLNLIEEIKFANVTWTYQQLFQHFVTEAKTDGDDSIFGFHTADLLVGGLGNDTLQGRSGSDIYVWKSGDGSDVIFDGGGAGDSVRLTPHASADFDYLRTGTDLILRLKATGETITFASQYLRTDAQGRAVELFEFSDRTVLFTDLNPEDIDVVGTNGADALAGSQFAETLDGRAGDDTLTGGSDGDTYLFDAGYGNDQIIDRQERASWAGRRFQEKEGTDRIVFGAGLSYATAGFVRINDDLVITFADRPDTLTIRNQFRSIADEVETFAFNDQTVTAADIEARLAIVGGNRGDNTLTGSLTLPNALDGRQGFDTLVGGNAADAYTFGIAYDFDRIVERVNVAGVNDRVIFGEGITADQLILRRDGLDLLIDLGNATDVLRIVGGLGTTGVEQFSFADGTLLTLADMRARMLVGTAGNDRLEGFDASADRLAGGAGTDELIGGTGNDTYVFGHGDGQDSARDIGGADRIEFGQGVTRDQVTFELVGLDLVIRLAPGNDSLVILGGADATSNAFAVESFVFTDGTTLTMGDVQTLIFATKGNGSSDLVDGATIDPALALRPGSGFDSVTQVGIVDYIFAKGDGFDRLQASSSTPTGSITIEDYASSEAIVRLASYDGDDLIISFPDTGEGLLLVGALSSARRFPVITFSDGVTLDRAGLLKAAIAGQITEGHDRVQGQYSTASTFEAGLGNDDVYGGILNDSYVFNRGDGRDVITDESGTDTLQIKGYLATDMIASRLDGSRYELILNFVGTDDQITLRSSLTQSYRGVETLVFADGSTRLVADLLVANAVVATAGDDVLTGTTAADTLTGGLGNDTLRGGSALDTYVYARGDGVDFIDDTGTTTIISLRGYAPGEVRLSLDTPSSRLLLQFADGGEIAAPGLSYTNSIRFENGTIWQRADFAGLIAATRSQENAVITGTTGSSTVTGGLGDDLIGAGSGSQTYLFQRGGGQDRFVDNGYQSNTVRLQGYTLAEATILRASIDPQSLTLVFAATGDRVELSRAYERSITNSPINYSSFVFDDQILTFAQMMARANPATSGDDRIEGSDFGDSLTGGAGNDLMLPGMGADRVIFARGDGRDEVRTTLADVNDILEIRGYAAADLIVSRHPWDPNGLIIRFAGTTDQVSWRAVDGLGAISLAQLVLADSATTLTRAELIALIPATSGAVATVGDDMLTGSAGNDTIEGLAGDDVINTKAGVDRIIFGKGDGHDAVYGKAAAENIVDFNEPFTPDGTYALTLRDVTPDDLLIEDLQYSFGDTGPGVWRLTIVSTGDSILIQNPASVLTEIAFSNGVVWQTAQILAAVVYLTAPNPDHYNYVSVDTSGPVFLGAGDEYFIATDATLANTFTYSRANGHDMVAPGGEVGQPSDDLLVLTDIASTEIAVRRFGVDFDGRLVLTFGDLTASITLRLPSPEAVPGVDVPPSPVASVQFSDGITLAWADLVALGNALAGADPARGAGTIAYDRATDSGVRFVTADGLNTETDARTINLANVDASDISYARRRDDLILSIAGDASGSGAGQIVVTGAAGLTGLSITVDGLPALTLADVYTEMGRSGASNGDDTIAGFGFDWQVPVVLAGGQGDDIVLVGNFFQPTVEYARGDGDDLHLEYGGFTSVTFVDITPGDVTLMAQGRDILLKIAPSVVGGADGGSIRMIGALATEGFNYAGQIAFAGGVVWTQAQVQAFIAGGQSTPGDDVVLSATGHQTYNLGQGNDFVRTEGFNDTYIYRNGDGHDVIAESGRNPTLYGGGPTPGRDLLKMTDFVANDLAFTRSGTDLLVQILPDAARGIVAGSIRMVDAFLSDDVNSRLVERIALAGGVTIYVLDKLAGLIAAQATSGDDIIVGSSLYDTLRGGAGDDLINGGPGYDTYIYARGDGHDQLVSVGYNEPYAGFYGHANWLTFENITPDQVTARLQPNGILLMIAPSAPGAADAGSILLRTADYTDDGALDRLAVKYVNFPDGSSLNGADLYAMALAGSATAGDDSLVGSDLADVIRGGAGNDLLRGSYGNDTYTYARGDGFDRIYETSQGVNTSNTLRLTGINTADVVLRAGAGTDLMVLVGASSDIANDNGRITVSEGLGAVSSGIQRIVFDDGTIWLRANFGALIAASIVTDGNDRITGTAAADTLRGAGGDDVLAGGAGDDTYLFTRGDGVDQLRETSGTDVLRITGYAAADLEFIRVGTFGPDLVIRFTDDADGILVFNGLISSTAVLERIEFTDTGEVVMFAEVLAALTAALATSGADIIVGTTGNDILAGGRGNDLLAGGPGSDSYHYMSGDGDDRISDTGTSGTDRLVLDVNPDDLAYALRLGPDGFDLVLRLPGLRDRIVLEGALGTASAGIEEIAFANGTVWSRADMRAQTLIDAQSAGADNLWGYSGADTVEMGAGNDIARGMAGSDTYVVRRGNGTDRIIEAVDVAATDIVDFRDYVSSEVSVARLFKGSNSVEFRFLSSGDVLIVENALATDGSGIETYLFSDGASWTAANILTRLDNTAPVAAADGYFTLVNGTTLTLTTAQLLRNDFDPDGDALLLVRVDGGANGAAEIDANGNVQFQANPGFSGATQFSYTISDGRGGFATGVVDLRVRPLAQVRDDAGFAVQEDGSLQIRAAELLANDADGDRMIIGQVRDAIGGTASLSTNGNITFVAAPNFNGTAQFTYVANTPEGGVGTGIVRIAVSGVNDAPAAVADTVAAFDENTARIITTASLIANDSDVDGNTISVVAVTGNANITVTLLDGEITITPRANFFGPAFFDYTLRDSVGATSVARVNLSIISVNSAPDAVGEVFAAVEDTPFFIAATDLLANDTDADGDALTISRVEGALGGGVRLYPNGVEFTPRDNFFGVAGFRYVVSDGQGGQTSAWVTVNVASVNDRPDAGDDRYSRVGFEELRGLEDQPLIIQIADLMNNDTDIEPGSLIFQSAANAVGGTLTMPGDDTIVFTPDPDFWGEATFSYLIADAGGAVDAAEVTLFFANVDDAPPVAVADIITAVEDTPRYIPIAALLGNDYDIDRDPLTLISFGPALAWRHGTLAQFDATTLVFTPGANETAPTQFYYTVSDGTGFAPSRGSILISMQAVNDEPVAGDDFGFTTQQSVPLVLRIADLMANDVDIEETMLSFSRVAAHTAGSIEIWQNQFIVVELGTGFTGPLTLDYEVTDGELFDTARVQAAVAPGYGGVITGSALVDLLIGTDIGETLYGLQGNDTIRAMDGDDLIFGGTGADAIYAGAGYDTVDFAPSLIGVRASLASRLGQGGDAQGDEYFAVEAFAGSAFGDTLDGNTFDNRLDGRGGDDALSGAAGTDTLSGGDGNDTLTGGDGADLLFGGAGSDTADYSESAGAVSVSLATLAANGGDAVGDVFTSIENLIGSDGADVLAGESAANALFGGRGADTLTGGAGDDTLSGGRGADAIFGGDGVDIASYAQSETGVLVDLTDATASGGDAQGDAFSGIEIIEGSYHSDTLIGDAGDNRLRGGVGADVIDGGAGFDTADYATAAAAVSVDLGSGVGTVGEAAGDQVTGVERVLGSSWNDTLAGGAGDETFVGGLGDDALAGGAGSDTYLFGFGAGADTLTEDAASGIDMIVLQAPVLRRDVSLVRIGDDLLIELENTGAFLTDTLRVLGHFATNAAGQGIEAIAFSEGVIWDRAAIDNLARLGRFNAADDLVRFQVEDVVSIIDPATLLLNDATEGVDDLELISVAGVGGATASIDANGMVRFQGALNQNGDAFFDYTVRDAYGRESTARVEVNLTAVNDAPVAGNDGVFAGIEDTILAIRIADLLGNDSDVDGDTLTLGSLSALRDPDGNPLYASGQYILTNGRASTSNGFIYFEPRGDHFGFAGFRYVLNDGNGGSTFGEVVLNFTGVNDAPRGDDSVTVRLGQVNEIRVSTLMLNDRDPEGDAFSFGNVQSVSNGTAELSPDGQTVYFTANALGDAVFTYVLTDSLGAARTITVDVNVRPLNDAPDARDDGGIMTFEDAAIIIDPADLLANDTDQNGDPLTITALDLYADNGRVAFDQNGMIVFTPRANFNGVASFEYTISDGQGGFDTAKATVTIVPRNDAPVLRPDVVGGVEDKPIIVLAGETFGNDFDPDGDVLTFSSINFLGVLSPMPADRTVAASFGFDRGHLVAGITISAVLGSGAALPSWLGFDAQTLEFTGVMPVDQVVSLSVAVTFTLPAALGGLAYTVAQVITPADAPALVDGLALVTGLVLLETEARSLFDATNDRGALDGLFSPNTYDFAPGIWAATAPSGRDLPDWINFDAATMLLSVDAAAVPQGAGPVTVRISHLPEQPGLEQGWLSTVTGQFGIEVVIDPAAGVLPSVNALLATQAFFAAQGLFAAPIDGTATVNLANGNPLPAWLTFDAANKTFTGTPPDGDYVGALQVRFAIPATSDRPAFNVIAEVVVDPVLDTRTGLGFTWQVVNNRVVFATPEDFDGSFVFTYDAKDTLNLVSDSTAIVVVNVDSRPEIVDAVADNLVMTSAVVFDIAVASLLANDFALAGNTIQMSGFTQPGVGSLEILPTAIDGAALSGLAQVTDAVWSARILGGGAAPGWISIDSATGQINARLPLDYQDTLQFEMTRTVADDPPAIATFDRALNGTLGAVLRYTLDSDTATRASFGYTISNDLGDVSSATVNIAFNRNLKANDDDLAVVEDTPLVINITGLLANDVDTDGDEISFVSLAGVTNGTTAIANGQITFTPTANFDGEAGFDYTITDGNGRSDTAHVTITVAANNAAPVLGLDRFNGTEDTPVEFSLPQIMINDSDANGDTLTFLGLNPPPSGVNVFLLPDGRWQVMPDVNINGLVTLTYSVTDGRLTSTGVIEINLAPVNDAPVLVADAGLTTSEDTALTVTIAGLLANDYDPEGDAFAVIEVYDPDNGTVSLTNGIATFTPRADYSGNAGFRYVVQDANGAQSIGYANIQVTPAFDPPFAILDRVTMLEDGSVLLDPTVLMANDISPDGDALVFLGFASSAVTQEGAFYRFTPQTNANGVANLTYTITNASGVPVNGVVRIDITAQPDAPVAGNDSLSMIEDQVLIVDPAQFLLNDTDPDIQGISITAVGSAAGLSVRLLADGKIEITPEADRTGAASFGYTLTDSSGLLTNAQVNVTIVAGNDAPVLLAPLSDRLATEETAFSIALQTNLFRDPDGDALTYSLTRADGSALPVWISFNALTQTMTGTAPANFTGALMLRLTVSDGQISISDDFALNVLNTQDPPVLLRPVVDVALDNAGAIIRVGTAFTFAVDTAAFADPDGQPLAYQARLVGGAALPTWLQFNGTSFTGTPPLGANGVLAIVLSASDGTAIVSDTFDLTIAAALTLPYDSVITGSGVITGTELRDQLNGGTGNDNFRDLAGNDDVYGGAGSDIFNAGAGADLYDGGAGTDRVTYVAATAGITLYMGAPTLSTGIALGDRFVGIEYLNGSNFADIIVSQGLIRLYGEGGDDVLVDSAGVQALWGGAGRDVFMFVDGDPSQDRIMDFVLGQDAIDLSRWGVISFDQLVIAERTNNAGVLQGDLLISFNGEGVIVEGMTAVNIPSLNGASFIFANPTTIDPHRWAGATIDGTVANDLMNGAFRDVDGQGISGGGQIIFGGLGNETIFDGAGNDQIFGGDGDDRFYNGAGADTIDGGAGRDELSYAYANGGVLFNMLDQTANAGQALGDRATTIERLHGSDFSDVLFGGALATLYGRAGDDYIRDGVGAQQLFGGTGLDIFAFEAGDRKADQIMDFVIGQDKIDISAWAVSSFSQLAITSRQTVSGNGTVNDDVLITFGREVIELDGLTAADRANLTASSFVLTAPAVFLAQRQAQQLAEGLPQAPDVNARTAPAAAQASAPAVSVSVAATMALAASMASSDSMAFVASPAAALRFGSYAALSSSITGDALAGGPTAGGMTAPEGSGGVLVDPSTTVTAFLSATQLAALDDNHFSFY